MTRIAGFSALAFGGFLLSTTSIYSTGAAAGPTVTPPTATVCAAMVKGWEKNYSYDEVTRCKPWRRSHADALYATLRRCQVRTKQAVGECGDELNAYTSFVAASTTVENPVFGSHPRKAYPAAPVPETEDQRATLEKRDDERRAAKRQAIIDSFGQGKFIPATTQEH